MKILRCKKYAWQMQAENISRAVVYLFCSNDPWPTFLRRLLRKNVDKKSFGTGFWVNNVINFYKRNPNTFMSLLCFIAHSSVLVHCAHLGFPPLCQQKKTKILGYVIQFYFVFSLFFFWLPVLSSHFLFVTLLDKVALLLSCHISNFMSPKT